MWSWWLASQRPITALNQSGRVWPRGLHRCWWQVDVGDFTLMKIFGDEWQNFHIDDIFWCWCPTLLLKDRECWWQKRLKPSPTSQSCCQHISSPTSVTNIDVACLESCICHFMKRLEIKRWENTYTIGFKFDSNIFSNTTFWNWDCSIAGLWVEMEGSSFLWRRFDLLKFRVAKLRELLSFFNFTFFDKLQN